MLRSDADFYKDLSDQVPSDVSDVDAKEMADLMKGVDDLDDALFGFTAKKGHDLPKKTPTTTDEKKNPVIPNKKTKGAKEFDEMDPLGDISLSDEEFFGGDNIDKIGKIADGIKAKPAKTEIDKTTKTKKIADLFGLDDEKTDGSRIEDKKIESRGGNEERSEVNMKKKESAADWLGIKESPKKTKGNLKEDKPFADSWNTDDLLPKDKPSSKSLPIKNTDQDSVFGKTDNTRKSMKKSVGDDDDDDDIFDLLEDKTSTKKTTKDDKAPKKQVPKGLLDELFDDPSMKPASRQPKQDRKDPFERNIVFDLGDKKESETSNMTGDTNVPSLGAYMPSLGGGSRRPGTGRRREGMSGTTPPSSLRLEEDWLSQPDSLTSLKPKSESMPSVEQKKSSASEMSGVNPSSSRLPPWLGGSGTSEPTPVSSYTSVQPQPLPATAPVPVTKPSPPPPSPAPVSPPQPAAVPLQSSTTPVVVVYQNEKTTVPQAHTMSSEQPAFTTTNVLQSSLELSKQTELALQRTEAQLMTAVHLKEQRNSIEALTARQAQLLETQEKHITTMLGQHLKKQSEAEARLEAQNQRIGALMQMLMTDIMPTVMSPKVVSKQDTTNGRHNNSTTNVAVNTDQTADVEKHTSVHQQQQQSDTYKLNEDIHILQIENSELKLQLELVEKCHKNELDNLSKIHRRETDAWQSHVGRLRKIIQEIGDEYKAKIKRLQDSELEMIQLYKEKFENLQKESMLDLRQLCEFHRVTMEQITSMNGLMSKSVREDDKFQSRIPRTPLDDEEMSARESSVIRKERQLSALQEEIKLQQRALEEAEEKVVADRLKNDETERNLKREGAELRFNEKTLERDQEKLKEQHESQLQHIKELQEDLMKEQTKIVEERLQIAGERARLDALAKLQGVNSTSSYDMMQARVEVHGALEAARELELELNEERQKLKQQQRMLENEKWRLQEIESDLSVRAQHMDSLVQVAESKRSEGLKALEQARLVEKRATETMREAEIKMAEVKEREQNLIKEQMELTKEHVILSKRREQLDQVLPELSSAESLYLQPISKAVIDPKLLIMKLKAEKELSLHS